MATFPQLYSAAEPSFFFPPLGQHLRHMEVPRLGVKSELQWLATAMWDLSSICDLHHSLRKAQGSNLRAHRY